MPNIHFDILVIGAGAQATAFLSSIYHIIKRNNKIHNIKIGVIDKKENIGCGNIYNHDYPWIIMNTPTTDLSVVKNNPNHFFEWVKKNSQKLSLNNTEFISRSTFGSYLKESFYFFVNELKTNGVIVETIDSLCSDIISHHKKEYIDIVLSSNKILHSKYIVFAVGPSQAQDHYSLQTCKNYIHNPLPALKNLENIQEDATVGIIGSNLTAIDVAITLKNLNHNGKIIMASRNGKLPEVKGKYLKSYPPQIALYSNYETLSKQKGSHLKLFDILKLVRKELNLHGFQWRQYFFDKKSKPECLEDFKYRVKEAREGATPFNIILGMIPEIAKTWRLVSNEELEIFMSKFYRNIHQKHGAIPLINAEHILSLLQSKQLIIKGLLKNITHDGKIFNIYFEDNTYINCDYIINATGPKRTICDINSKTPYLTPCAKGFIKELSIGGVIIDTPTGKILNQDGNYENKLRAIGHNAEGSHPFINNYAWILESSFEVAESLLTELEKETTYD